MATAQNSDSVRAAQKRYSDSLTNARLKAQEAQKAYNDSLAAARRFTLDSTRMAQKKITDSIRQERERVADSVAAIRSYLRSKQYNDSLDLARQKRLDSLRLAQQQHNDSVKAERERVADSIAAVRQQYNDSLKNALAIQKAERERILDSTKAARQRISDSLSAIREYRQSDQYKDSVAAVRKRTLDSMKAVRVAYNDSVKAVRKQSLDSMIAVRKAYNDSLRAVLDSTRLARQEYLDSMKVVRLARADSLAKVKEAREAARKEKLKENEKKKGLALELKIKKKQDQFTNEKMRKKKWSLPRQVIQNTFTRYNYYFNANRKMEEAQANMLRIATDNYDSLIALFPFDPDRDSTRMKSDMDTIISKASVGIQIHDPRGKWQDNLYLIAGQAFYYKGDYKNAAASFKYIVAQAEADKKEEAKKAHTKLTASELTSLAEPDEEGLAGVLDHRTSKNEAMLWLSRTFTQNGEEGQAQALLDIVGNDSNFPERLRGQLALEQAYINIRSGDLRKATDQLAIVATDPNQADWIRQRAAFLNGQILQSEGNYARADTFFNVAIDLHPALDMDFYARKNIVMNSLAGTEDPLAIANMLEKMAIDTKYRPYYDQIYYAMGKADLKINNTEKALADFRKSVDFNQNNRRQKGLSYASLGDEYYRRNDYTLSKRAYDSAAMFLTDADEPMLSDARQRSLSLDQIAVPAHIVQEQDSLLQLAGLSEREQRANARRHIRDLERMMNDSAFMAQNGPPASGGAMPGGGMMGGGSTQWYFANPTLMQQGSNEFKMKWGNRTLKDNWNRSGGGGGMNGDAEEEEMTEEERIAGLLPDEDSLVAAIPHTPEQIQTANEKLMEAYFQLGKAYYSLVSDYPKAIVTYDTLDARYPAHGHTAEVLYHRYLMAMKDNRVEDARAYNARLQQDFNGSEWANMLKDAAEGSSGNPLAALGGGPAESIEQHFDKTYELMNEGQFAEVVSRVEAVDKLYPSQAPRYQKKYNVVKAIALAGLGNYGRADTILSQFIAINPKDSLAEWATTVLNYIRGHAPPPPPVPEVSAADSMKSTGADTLAKPGALTDTAALESTPKNTAETGYSYNPTLKHYVLIFSPILDGRLMGVKSGLGDYNRSKHADQPLTVSMLPLKPGQGMIVAKEFPNATAAKRYAAELRAFKNLFREYGESGGYEVAVISPENLELLTSLKDFDQYRKFYQQKYK